jgi:glucan phosphoethanolaminetransferase (alkaline phosphatase superfamily)
MKPLLIITVFILLIIALNLSLLFYNKDYFQTLNKPINTIIAILALISIFMIIYYEYKRSRTIKIDINPNFVWSIRKDEYSMEYYDENNKLKPISKTSF